MRTALILLAFLILGTLCLVKLARNGVSPEPVTQPSDQKVERSGTPKTAITRPSIPSLNDAKVDGAEQIRALAKHLAANDPAQAAAHIQRLIDEGNSEVRVFVAAFLEEYAAINPAQAVAWSDFLPQDLKLIGYDSIGRTWAARDAKGAAAWAGTVIERSLRMAAVKAVSGTLDPVEHSALAARWAQELSAGKDAALLSDVIVHHWAREDIRGSFSWVVGLEDQTARDRGLEELTSVLSQQDPQAASEWVQKFPNGQLRNNAIQSTILNWAAQDPKAAAEWLSGLKEQTPFEAGAQPIFQSWSRQDPEAAKQWLQAAPLPDDLKNYMLKTAPQPPP